MERFEFVANLGEGAYGTVWLCLDRETGQRVAMKRFKDAHTDEEVMRLALREIRMLKSCTHANIVRLNEAFRSKSGRVYMVLEYVPRTLTEELRAHPRGFPVEKVKLYTYQLLQAAAYLHQNRLLHRDLKPANILISEAEELKLCDFGFARTMVGKNEAEYTTYVVTRWYRAPEIIVNDAYGSAVDIWAIGCLFSEMACGRPLFPGRNSFDQLWLTMRCLGQLPERQAALMRADTKLQALSVPAPEDLVTLEKRFPEFTPDMMQLLRGCLALDPARRLTAEQAMQLPYFDDVRPLLAIVDARKVKLQERLVQEAALVRAAAAAGAPVVALAAAVAAANTNGAGATAPQMVAANAATMGGMPMQPMNAAYASRPVHMHMPSAALSQGGAAWMRGREAMQPAVPHAAPSGRPAIAPLPPHVAALAAAAAAQAQQRQLQEQQAAAASAQQLRMQQPQPAMLSHSHSQQERQPQQQQQGDQQQECGQTGPAALAEGTANAGEAHTPSQPKRTRSSSQDEAHAGASSVANVLGEPAAQRGRSAGSCASDCSTQQQQEPPVRADSMQVDGAPAAGSKHHAGVATSISAPAVGMPSVVQAPTPCAADAADSQHHHHHGQQSGSPVSVLPDGGPTSEGSSGMRSSTHHTNTGCSSSCTPSSTPTDNLQQKQQQHAGHAAQPMHAMQQRLMSVDGSSPNMQGASGASAATAAARSSSELGSGHAGGLGPNCGAQLAWSGNTDMAVHLAQEAQGDGCRAVTAPHHQSQLLASSSDGTAHQYLRLGSASGNRRRSLGQAMRDIGHKLEALITRPFNGSNTPPLALSPPPAKHAPRLPSAAGTSSGACSQEDSGVLRTSAAAATTHGASAAYMISAAAHPSSAHQVC